MFLKVPYKRVERNLARRVSGSGAGGTIPSGSRRGSALLIVLAFIVILAVVLVVFLSNSQRALKQSESSSAILQTQMLSQVAVTSIIDDIGEEMRAGAANSSAPGDVMQVSQPWAMVPGRVLKVPGMLADPKFDNLVKQSVSGTAFFPGDNPATFSGVGKARASGTSTSVPSRNQRIISAERWSKPQLLGDATGAGNFTAAQAPDWILIARAGAVEDSGSVGNVNDKTLTNANYVLGRFAYNIYQVDGLLDVNVAGFDPGDSKAAGAAVARGSMALADLRAIPGLSADASVKAIIDWRNKESATDYPAMIAGLSATSVPGAAPGNWGEPGGFLESYTDGIATDNRFFSRQDLLNYFDHEFGTAGSQKAALPYLTTFSADRNQPSFRPDPNRPRVERAAGGGGNDAFGDETQPVASQINPPLLAVLDAGGDPVIKRRFPLDRLKYVFPVPAEPAKVSEYFGMTWDVGTQAWTYVDGDSVKRLNEITGREPNMIELLKAGLATGSLGGQFDDGEPLGSPRAVGSRDASINYHIMRIAAAIIDQYDGDSYPTRINFGSYQAFGVEDLPYIYGMRVAPYRLTVLDPVAAVLTPPAYPATATGSLYRNSVLIQPSLWNPHAVPTTFSATNRPTNFRITASSGLDVQPKARRAWWQASATQYYSNWPQKTGDPRDISQPIAFAPTQDYMTFSANASTAFREPFTLRAPNFPPDSNAKAFTSGAEFSETTLAGEQDNTGTSAIGFRAGWSWSGPWQTGATTGNATWLQEGRVDTNGIDFELQYQTASGDWITYDRYEKFVNTYPYRLDRLNSGAAAVNPRFMQYYLRADPRVDRYGARAPLAVPTAAGFQQGQSLRPGTDAGAFAQRGWPADGSIYNFTFPGAAERYWGLISENSGTGLVYYEDPDGVLRRAAGGFSSGLNGLPMATGNSASRPVLLNRPFRSVAELSNVLRDQPWKQLDFFTPQSGDAALLDMFCIYESQNPTGDSVVAGRVNLNTRRLEVIAALFRGVEMQSGSALSSTQATSLAQALVDWTSNTDASKGPLRNRAELVGKFISGTNYSGFSSELDSVLSGVDRAIPFRRQNALGALTDAGTTRAWTFLVDLIVQDGQFLNPASGGADFVVRGEKRLWVHVAMDRFTGEVISQREEEVRE